MNWKDLYESGEVNGNTVFYVDENCTMLFTGKVEDYFNGKLSWECDIVNGLREGVEKEYYDNTGELSAVTEMKNNRAYGLHIEYYKSGKISSISTIIGEVFIDIYSYDEDGKLKRVTNISRENAIGINYKAIEDKIPALREEYDLEKISEEILSGKGVSEFLRK